MKAFKKFIIFICIFIIMNLILLAIPSPYTLSKNFKVEPSYSKIQQIEMSDVIVNYDSCMLEYLINRYIEKIDYEEGYYYFP